MSRQTLRILLSIVALLWPAGPAHAGLFDLLFGPPRPPPVRQIWLPPAPAYGGREWQAPPMRAPRSPRGDTLPAAEPMRALANAARSMDGSGGGAAMCVRACDGFYFPVPGEASLPTARAEDLCRTACPGTPVSVYTMRGGAMEDARGDGGRRYGDLAKAFSYRTTFDKACQCRPTGMSWVERILTDPTLRRGDLVVSGDTARVYRGPSSARTHSRSDFVEIQATGAVPAGTLKLADRVLGFSFREAQARTGPALVVADRGSGRNEIVVTPVRGFAPAATAREAPAVTPADKARPAAARVILPKPYGL